MKQEPSLTQLQGELGYSFADPTLLECCLTHVSHERSPSDGHNEVLEFLGDAVLDLAVSELLIRRHPERSEGELSRMRAGLVNSDVLAEKAVQLNLGAFLRLGKGEERSGGRTKPSILAGAFEALIGAVFRDGGYGRGAPYRRTLFRRGSGREKTRPAGFQNPASGNQPNAFSRAAGLPDHCRKGPRPRETLCDGDLCWRQQCLAAAKAPAKNSRSKKRPKRRCGNFSRTDWLTTVNTSCHRDTAFKMALITKARCNDGKMQTVNVVKTSPDCSTA